MKEISKKCDCSENIYVNMTNLAYTAQFFCKKNIDCWTKILIMWWRNKILKWTKNNEIKIKVQNNKIELIQNNKI